MEAALHIWQVPPFPALVSAARHAELTCPKELPSDSEHCLDQTCLGGHPLPNTPPQHTHQWPDGHDAKAQLCCLKWGDYGSVHAPEPFCPDPWGLAETKSTKPHCHPAVSLVLFQFVLGALSQKITCLNSLPPTTPGSGQVLVNLTKISPSPTDCTSHPSPKACYHSLIARGTYASPLSQG